VRDRGGASLERDGDLGHPEDAVAIALAVYALIFTLDTRFVGAGWLFGVAVAFQPLVLLMLPVLHAVAGRQRMPGLIIRSVVHRKFGQKPRWRQRRNQRRRVDGHPADID
jgi:hypothetical protein